jgi:hypothetical protein
MNSASCETEGIPQVLHKLFAALKELLDDEIMVHEVPPAEEE